MEKGSRIQENAERLGIVVLIPAYEPSSELPKLVRALKERFPRIVIVNDGSTRGLQYIDEVRPLVEKVLVHEVNRGKGAAIKTALDYIGEADVITVDADGQHLVADIVRVAEAMKTQREGLTLGVRAFSGKVPLRSRFGNWWTRIFFYLLTGLYVRDTQTGLRGIPSTLAKRVRELPGERYEYEMVMLADAKRHPEPPMQVPIATVYLNDNAESHFSPLKDTVRIYSALFRYLFRR